MYVCHRLTCKKLLLLNVNHCIIFCILLYLCETFIRMLSFNYLKQLSHLHVHLVCMSRRCILLRSYWHVCLRHIYSICTMVYDLYVTGFQLRNGFKWLEPTKSGLISHQFTEPGVFYYTDRDFSHAAEYIGTIIVKPKRVEHHIQVSPTSYSPSQYSVFYFLLLPQSVFGIHYLLLPQSVLRILLSIPLLTFYNLYEN